MAFPSYSDVWQNFQSGHFDVAAQAALAKAHDSQNQPYHYVTHAFAGYAIGYREFQYTYRYSEIKNKVVEPHRKKLEGKGVVPAKAIFHLLEFLDAELDANNANDCVDLAGWEAAGRRAALAVQNGLMAVEQERRSLTWDDNNYRDFLEGLKNWFESSSLFYEAVCAYAGHLASIKGIEWSDSEESRCRLFERLEQAAKDLEEEYHDQDSASEIRAHLRFGRRMAEATAGQAHLCLEGVEASWLFPFQFPLSVVQKLFAKLGNAQENGGPDLIDADLLLIREGPLIDIIETSYGKEGFKHALILWKTLQPLRLKVGSLEFACDFALHLYKNGIGVLRLSGRIPESVRVDVLRARLLLGLSYPFLSGEYKVILTSDEVSRDFPNLREAASAIVCDFIYPVLRRVTGAQGESGGEREDRLKPEPLHEMDWFSYLVVDRIVLGGATVLSFNEIQSHPELKALYFPVREARASYYDWAAYEDQPMENLARIRSHPSDIFFMSGNQAFMYFRDDPFWAVLEYRHTLDQTFMPKSWVISLHQQVDRSLERAREGKVGAREPGSELSFEIDHMQNVLEQIAAVRRDSISVSNLISNSAVSLYPDHGTLLRRMHAVRELPELLELLERKVRNLGESESSLLNNLKSIEDRRQEQRRAEEERRREQEARRRALVEGFVQGALAVIGVLTILTAGLQLLQLKVGEGFSKFVGIWNFWHGRQAAIDPAIFRDTSLIIVQLVIIVILLVGIILVAVLKRRR